MARRWSDQQIVNALLERYGPAIGERLQVTQWPDTQKRGSQTPKSVDALAGGTGGTRLALEVTKIESFPEQRRDDATLARLNAQLSKELCRLPAGVGIWIPYSAFPVGKDWKAIEYALRSLLVRTIDHLKEGISTYELDGVPFPVTIDYDPGLDIEACFGRIGPTQSVKRTSLFTSIVKALGHKAEELRGELESGAKTVLILEHHDMALASSARVYAAYFAAAAAVPSDHLTDVFFCRTESAYRLDQWYCFFSTEQVLSHFNPSNFRFGPSHESYWTGISSPP